jgi:hypothetical protein
MKKLILFLALAAALLPLREASAAPTLPTPTSKVVSANPSTGVLNWPTVVIPGYGTAGAPAFSFAGDTDTGLFHDVSNNQFSFSAGGTKVASVLASGIYLETNKAISFAGTGAITTLNGMGATGTGKNLLMLTDPFAVRYLRINADNTVTARSAAELLADIGGVAGPASATDNAIVRFDGTTGKLIQDSAVTIADTSGDITTAGNVSAGAFNALQLLSSSGAIKIGPSSTSIGTGALTLGDSNSAIGNGALAIGQANGATGDNSTAVGKNNTITGAESTAVGKGNSITGDYTSAFGRGNSISTSTALAAGYNNTVTGSTAMAVGSHNEATADDAVAVGGTNVVSGIDSTAVGHGNFLTANFSGAFGYYITGSVLYVQELGTWYGGGRHGAVRVHNTGMVALTVQDTATPYTDGGSTDGAEADGTVMRKGYALRRDGGDIYIDMNDASGTVTTIQINQPHAETSYDFPSIASGDYEDLVISVTGAVVGDYVTLALPAAIDPGLVFNGIVTASGDVTVRCMNITGSAIDPTGATFGVKISHP